MSLLEDYVTLLQAEARSEETTREATRSYLMPSHTVSPDEWAAFENVYQIHCPKIYMDNTVRDVRCFYVGFTSAIFMEPKDHDKILLLLSCKERARISFGNPVWSKFLKHLDSIIFTYISAVKFIRDQANAALAIEDQNIDDPDKVQDTGSTAQLAASALRKMLKIDYSKSSVEVSTEKRREAVDPLNGWSNGVSLRKSDCCLLLKPQIVMCGQESKDTCIVAAVQAKLQAFAIMDDSNADDPVSGKVMSR